MKLTRPLLISSLFVFAAAAHASTFIQGPSLFETPTSTVSSGGTTTLTFSSETVQILTGTSNHTFRLPNMSTFTAIGRRFEFRNRSTGTLTVQYQDGTTLTTVRAGEDKNVRSTSVASANGVWDISYADWVRRTGDSMSGNLAVTGDVSATGTLSGATATITGPLTAASVSATGGISGATVTSTGAINGASLALSGNASLTSITALANGSFGGTLSVTGASNLSSVSASGNISAAGELQSGKVGTGTGGAVTLRDDTGTFRWKAGIDGTAGGQDYILYDYVANSTRFKINSSGHGDFLGNVVVNGGLLSTTTSSGNGEVRVNAPTAGDSLFTWYKNGVIKAYAAYEESTPELYIGTVSGRMDFRPGGTSMFTIGDGGSNAILQNGVSLIQKGATSGQITHAVPSTVTSYALTWPSAQGGASTCLENDGSGGLSWGTCGGGGSFSGFADGSAGSPGAYFSSETSTGFFRPGSSIIAASLGGTETFRSVSGAILGTPVATNYLYGLNTVDDVSDTASATLWAGSGSSIARGAGIQVFGNQNSGRPGAVDFYAGQPAEAGSTHADFRFYTGNGATERVRIAQSGEFRLMGSSSGYVGQKSPATATSYDVTWPDAQGSANSVLRNNGSGTLRWQVESGTEHVTVASICSASPCTISRSSSGVSSVTRGSTGAYTINFVSGTWSSVPTCTINSFQQGTQPTIPNQGDLYGSQTTTSYPFSTLALTAPYANQDSSFSVTCVGAR